jgi:DNA helicase-2/ATP-dependent DNA helicase PcrA
MKSETKLNLTPEQIKAITAPLEPALVIAGAGTGKTSVMAERVLWLIEEAKIEPEEILGLTFTNKAAQELRTRVRETIGSSEKFQNSFEITEPNIGTYHAFALQILNDHGLLIGVESDLKPINETTRATLAFKTVLQTQSSLKNLEKSPRYIAKQLLILDNQMAEHDLKIDSISKFSDKLLAQIATTRSRKEMRDLEVVTLARVELANLVNEFRELKRDEGIVDFADQMRFALQLVKSHPEVVDQLRNQYKAVLLDEYQDTSVIQRLLLSEIFGQAHPVTAVGDPLQAIYGWRGASVSNIDSFPHHFPQEDGNPARKYPLTANFRSGQKILNHANQVSKDLRDIHFAIDSLVAGKATNSEVNIGLHLTWNDEIEDITNRIKSLVVDREVKPEQIAVLSRNGKELLAIYDLLISKGIPATFSGKRDLIDVPEVSEVLSYLRLLDDPTHNPSLVRILAGPRFEIDPKDLALLSLRANELVKDHKFNKENKTFEQNLLQSVDGTDVAELAVLADALNSPGNSGYGIGVKEKFNKLRIELEILRKHITEPLSDIIYRIINQTGLLIEIMASDQLMTESRYEALMSLQDLAESFDQGSPHGVVREFLAWLNEADELESTIEFAPTAMKNAVSLMTIHGAKGLEFPIVFIPAVCENVFPNNRSSMWYKKPELIPYELRADASSLPSGFQTETKEFDAYTDQCKAHSELEERRLMYVALTRAENELFVSSHWWGPTQKKVRGPSPYLLQLKEIVEQGHGQIVEWTENTHEENPTLDEMVPTIWPPQRDQVARNRRLDFANYIESQTEVDESALSQMQKTLLENWDKDIESLITELTSEKLVKKSVAIPDTLNVTKTIKLMRDPTEFAKQLVRPMPSKPIDQARRGTQFHFWIEKHFAMPALLDSLDLPGAADEKLISDDQLETMKNAFLNSAWANKKPLALEWPFDISIGGRSLRGRIDAVFETENGIELIDWKTGVVGKSDDLQLAWYRFAWWKMTGTAIDKITAAFVYVPSMEIARPKELLAPEVLLESISG